MANVNGHATLVTLISQISEKEGKDGKKVNPTEVSVAFDFTGVSTSQLQNEAARSIMIKLAGKTRAKTTRKENKLTWAKAVAEVPKVVKVAEFLKDTRSRKSPEKRAAEMKSGIAKLDEKGRAELLKALQAMK